jgi:uncharacterized membrane protein
MIDPTPSPTNNRIHWLLTGRGRLGCGGLAGALSVLATFRLPPEMRTVISFDTGAVIYVVLFCTLISGATAEHAAVLSGRHELSGAITIVAIVLLSFVSVIAVAALLNNLAHAPHWLNIIHLTTSLLAVVLAWLLAHIFFGLHYMALYYSDTEPGDSSPHARGLEFYNHPNAGYWDFMYFSFTIGMCFGTSDVTITTTAMRRVTLLHAIFSFLFVAAIVGFVVNILSSLA